MHWMDEIDYSTDEGDYFVSYMVNSSYTDYEEQRFYFAEIHEIVPIQGKPVSDRLYIEIEEYLGHYLNE